MRLNFLHLVDAVVSNECVGVLLILATLAGLAAALGAAAMQVRASKPEVLVVDDYVDGREILCELAVKPPPLAVSEVGRR
jgi:hypothetical protein